MLDEAGWRIRGSTDGALVVVSGRDGYSIVREGRSGAEFSRKEGWPWPLLLDSVAVVGPDCFAVARSDGTIYMRRPGDLSVTATLAVHGDRRRRISAGGDVLTAIDDGPECPRTISRWDSCGERMLSSKQVDCSPGTAGVLSPDGQLFALDVREGGVEVYDVERNERIQVFGRSFRLDSSLYGIAGEERFDEFGHWLAVPSFAPGWEPLTSLHSIRGRHRDLLLLGGRVAFASNIEGSLEFVHLEARRDRLVRYRVRSGFLPHISQPVWFALLVALCVSAFVGLAYGVFGGLRRKAPNPFVRLVVSLFAAIVGLYLGTQMYASWMVFWW